MDYMKDGKKRTGFHPVQDLAGDGIGQEQAHRVADGAILQIALGKLTKNPGLIKALMDLWNKKPIANEEPLSIEEVFLKGLPSTLSDKEKKLVEELRKLVLGF